MPEIPYPLRANGLAIRYLPIIERLSQSCTIDLIITGKHSADPQSVSPLNTYCRKMTCVGFPDAKLVSPQEKFFTRTTFLLPWSMPRSWVQYGRKHMIQQIREATAHERYDVAICVTGYAYPFTAGINAKKLVVDFVDSPSVLAERNVIGSSRAPLVRKYEWLKTANWEAKIIRSADVALYISKTDADYVPAQLTPGKQRRVVPNGFSASEYTPAREPSVRTPNIGFLGNMSYYPNIEAAHWLHDRIFKPLQKKHADLNLYIIGRAPAASINELASDTNVHVTGAVENIWPYMNAIDMFVFPLQRGAGLKNKILEAMFARRPVLTSFIGNEGLEAVSGRDIIVCTEPKEFQAEIERLIASPSERERLGTSGHRHVVDTFAWDEILNTYERMVFE